MAHPHGAQAGSLDDRSTEALGSARRREAAESAQALLDALPQRAGTNDWRDRGEAETCLQSIRSIARIICE